ncbi:MFS transporter [Tessaracoccus sp. HF-7]|nr:MFS transporter [Tessaracoccus caeni]
MLYSWSALLWGLQAAFLAPVLALLLVTLYGATPADIGWVLSIYNAAGFVATILIPAWADRHRNYLRPMLICAALTVALAGTLALATSLPMAVVALVALGAPGSVGSTLLFAELRHSGVGVAVLMQTRAIVSVAWVAGPPLATLIMGVAGNRSILPVLAGLGVLNVVGTLAMASARRRPFDDAAPETSFEAGGLRIGKVALVGIVVAFTLLQATNAAVTSIMTLYVTDDLGLALLWGGVVLGVAAFLEVPAFWLIGRLSGRYSSRALMVSGCVAGIVFYVGLVFASGPVVLLALQVPNAWFFAIVAGTGLSVFQDSIPKPGLATGLNMNTRRIGAVISGPIIAIASVESLGFPGIFAVCAGLTVVALVILLIAQPRSAAH